MIRLPGIFKVTAVLALDFSVLCGLFNDASIAAIVIGVMALYVWLGGYLVLFKENAIRSDKLSSYDRKRLHAAKNQLTKDVKIISSVNISRLKIYLIPGDDDMQTTAYGANCVSVSRGILNNTDPVMLNAVLAHEVSHIINLDPEFNRAVFCSITLLVGTISVMSAVTMVIIFLIFLLLSCFRSWLGVMVFRGTTKAVGGIFGLLQRGIVAVYRTLLSLASRHAEYRSDLYSCSLGYGLQLAHFLTIVVPESRCHMTLTEALYRSHPPTQKRIARLEKYISNEIAWNSNNTEQLLKNK